MFTHYTGISLEQAEDDEKLKAMAAERVCCPIYPTRAYKRLIVQAIVGRRQIFLRGYSMDRLLHRNRSQTFSRPSGRVQAIEKTSSCRMHTSSRQEQHKDHVMGYRRQRWAIYRASACRMSIRSYAGGCKDNYIDVGRESSRRPYCFPISIASSRGMVCKIELTRSSVGIVMMISPRVWFCQITSNTSRGTSYAVSIPRFSLPFVFIPGKVLIKHDPSKCHMLT
jgi:hypothetical protein